MTRTKHSVIYQLIAPRTATGYVGMDHFRVCTDRYKEHLTRIRDSELQSDPKYNFMSRQGGPGSWIYVPYIFSSLPVKKQMLLTLESMEIQLYPKYLNKVHK